MLVCRPRLRVGSLSAAERYVGSSPTNPALVDGESTNHSIHALNETRGSLRKNVRTPQQLAVMSGFG